MRSCKLLLIIALWALLVTPPTFARLGESLSKFATSNAAFSRNMIQSFRSPRSGVLSPLSFQAALGMLKLGARENTARQMATVFQVEDALEGFKQLLNMFKEDGNITLRLINRMYVSESANLSLEFLQAAQEKLEAYTRKVNFNDPNTASVINMYIEESTAGTIPGFVTPDSYNSNTSILLVNTLYFNGRWKTPFEATSIRPFHTNPETEFNIPFMHMMVQEKDNIRVGQVPDLNVRVLQVPYKGERVSLLVMLPNIGTTVEQLECQLWSQKTTLTTILQSLRKASHFKIYLPKFKYEQVQDANNLLQQMGLTDMFNPSIADFSGISFYGHLYVSNVINRANFALTNDGTTESASTYVRSALTTALLSPPPAFEANRPFVFVVVHHTTEQKVTTLFYGRMVRII